MCSPLSFFTTASGPSASVWLPIHESGVATESTCGSFSTGFTSKRLVCTPLVVFDPKLRKHPKNEPLKAGVSMMELLF